MGKYDLTNSSTQTADDVSFKEGIVEHFNQAHGSVFDKLHNFSRFVPRQSLSLFLAKNELYKKICGVHGNIVECGVFMGGGLFSWSQLASIYDPVNHNRRIIGFDTFAGLTDIKAQDTNKEVFEHKSRGAYCFDSLQELEDCAELHDLNRSIGHIPKIELIKGDALETIPSYVEDNKHLVVSLLYLDFDLYEPTLCALEHLFPRMPRGAIIAFDELNQKQWPGETLAVLEQIGIRNLRIERFPFTPSLSYAVLD